MKIALLAPIEESVPPKRYGGVETVVHTLAEQLHAMGHSVTVFASGDSRVSCSLVPLVDKAIGSGRSKRIREALTYESLIKAAHLISEGGFDIVHNHMGWQALLFKDMFKTPMLTTIHWTLASPCENHMYSRFKDMPVVSISNNQRQHAPGLNYAATIYHGLNTKLFRYNPSPKDYIAFLGRFSPVKGPVEAIKVIRQTKERLVMAGKVNSFEAEYFEREIQPYIDNKQIQFIGEINRKQTIDLLRNAKALLSPIQWDEPFGLTNIEAMACGTPVIGTNRGALLETIADKQTGFLCSSEAEFVKSIGLIPTIKRQACRDRILHYFSDTRMAEDYIGLYKEIATVHLASQLQTSIYGLLGDRAKVIGL